MAAAIEEAKQFLFRHPWATSDVDNPVRLLQEVVDEVDRDYQLIDEGCGDHPSDEDVEEEETSRSERLLAFIKGLRDDMKISEIEYQMALQQAG